jgi:hypothetical protein
MSVKQQIESVLPILRNYQATGQARVQHEQGMLISKLVGQLFGTYNIAISCQSCIIHWLSQLDAYNSTLPAEQPAIVEEVKASKKPKNCCKNGK